MSLLFGGGSKTKPQFTGLSAQTSTSAIPITIGFGKNRSSHNIIWQGDFQSHKKKQKAGKGGPAQTTYTYSASFILALGWGEASGVTRVWKDQSKITSYTELGFSFFPGTTPQDPWGYILGAHPDEALGYPGIAYMAVANYDLGQGNTLPQHSFEIEWPLFGTQVGGNGDADPAQVLEQFLTNPGYGVGFDFDIFDQASVFSSGQPDSAYQTYCRAMWFGMSPVLSSQETARDVLIRWAKITNTAVVWNGYQIKMRPYGSEEVTAHGATYVPDFPVRFNLTPADLLGGKEDPITFDRTDPSDAKNGMSITISNRGNEYNELPVSWRDQGLVDQFGFLKADSMDAKEICEPEMAKVVVALLGQRVAYVRNTYKFTLGPQYVLLEPMDVLSITAPGLGTLSVMITEFEESDDDVFTIVADEYNGAISIAPHSEVQPSGNNPINTATPSGPVNEPVIFEPPTSGQIWAAVSGVDVENWGGCYVWLSTDDTNYSQVGEVTEPARQGVTTSALPTYAGANPDTVNTFGVDLTMSGGELEDASSGADAAAGVTVSYVGGELLSFENADPTGAHTYNLSSLYRGQGGTTPALRASGSKFARLDDAVFKYTLPPAYIGQLLYIKFQSYNSFGGYVEDIATVTAYEYVPSGAGYGGGAGGAPKVPTGFTALSGAGFVRLNWAAAPANDGVTKFTVYRATGAGQAFGTATAITSVAGETNSYTDVTGTANQAYTYFVVATNGVGDSVNSAGQDGTPTPAGGSVSPWKVNGTGTGASQALTLPFSGVDENGVFVYVNGLRLETSEYSIATDQLTLTTNATGDTIEVIGIVQ